jgi:hypothetical protein
MWLHNPVFLAANFAANIARVAPTRHRKKDQDPVGYWHALAASSVGLIEEIPFLGSLTRDIEEIADDKRRGEWFARKTASLAVPGVLQWIAKKLDEDKARKPHGLKQEFQDNIPGLRESVPLAPAKK